MLFKKLKEYAKQDIYPFHMPGHKRRFLMESEMFFSDTSYEKIGENVLQENLYVWKNSMINPYMIDITEIDGFDNLHHAEEILKDVQQEAANLYGAKQSFYLVNGSTCGILTAISACVKKRGQILIARNCHKSAYHALFLKELHPIYLYPKITSFGLQGQILVKEVERLLQENPKIEAVFLTSPTYDGIVSDIKTIADVVHSYGIPLIVDGAHGAHFGFVEDFPENPIQLGADIVIESVHKTLPAFTQTALLHVCSERISIEKIKRYLGIYESSSPSYFLMAGIDCCIEYMKRRGKEDLKQLSKHLDDFYERTQSLQHLLVLRKGRFVINEVFDVDKSKVLIFSLEKEISGGKLQQILLEDYHLQMEMASGQYVLALCSLMDTKEGFVRLAEALEAIDKSDIWREDALFKHTGKSDDSKTDWNFENIYRPQIQKLQIYETEDLEKEEVSFGDAVGKISGEYLFLYPPGIPFLVSGELITEDVVKDIRRCEEQGLEVLGLKENKKLLVIKE